MAAKTEFIAPTLEEVIEHIQEKKKEEWPKKFCEYYAGKFWNYYDSVGWVIAGRAKMKNWKSAFSNQWLNLRFQEDLDMLKRLTPTKKVISHNNYQPIPVATEIKPNLDTVTYMDEILQDYVKHPTLVPKERLASCYDWLKEKKLIRITKEQKDIAIQAGDVNKGKAIVVEFVFSMMAANLWTFNKLVYAR